MNAEKQVKTWNAVRWVLIVLGVGFLVGLVLAVSTFVTVSGPPPGPHGPPIPPRTVTQAMTVLSTVNLSLLVALLIVYARTYRSTRAPFILGLCAFLAALLLEGILTSPLLFRAFGASSGGLGPFLTLGQLLMCVALTTFLYLSLE